MREPAVERQPRVTKISLCAIGTPVSGVASPLASRASAAAACASVSSSLMSVYALRSLACARARKWRASSVAETCLPCSSADSSLMVMVCMVCSFAMSGLFDDLGHEVQAVLGGRRRLLVIVAAVWLIGNIVAQAQREARVVGSDRLRQRFDAAGVDRLHLLDQRKNAVELVQRRGSLLVAEFELGQNR